MNTLTTTRNEVADVLAPLGVTTYAHVPGRMNLPAAFIMAGSPYIEQGETFGSRLVRFIVVLAEHTASNLEETEALDDRIEHAQKLLEADGWLIEQVAQPTVMQFNNTDGLVAEITISTPITFTEQEN